MKTDGEGRNGGGLGGGVRVYSTCPPSSAYDREEYLSRLPEIAAWSEDAGCDGMLVYTDNSLVDPWALARTILQATGRLIPLVAVQPAYMHPYTAAKKVATLAYLEGRRVDLNMVAGGFRKDLLALGDATPHDRRYDRLREYVAIMQGLFDGGEPVSLDGDFYTVDGLRLEPPLESDLRPRFLVSGSSDAGLETARRRGMTPVQYPLPSDEQSAPPGGTDHAGIRVGIVARDDREQAWRIAKARFPEEREGQLKHQLAMSVSDSVWHERLSDVARSDDLTEDSSYWMVPFENYKTFCPYLVGDHDEVAGELGAYLSAGFDTLITDVPFETEDLEHIGEVLDLAGTVPSGRR